MSALAAPAALPATGGVVHDLRPKVPDLGNLSFRQKLQVLRRVLSWILPYRFFLFLLLTLNLVEQGLALFDPFLTQIIIDDVLGNSDRDLLHAVVGAMIALFFIRTIYGALAHYISFFLSTRVDFEMRSAFFDHLDKLSIRFYEQNPLAEIAQTENSNLTQVQQFILASLSDLPGHVFGLLTGIVVLLTINFRLGLYSVLSLPVWAVMTHLFTKKLAPMSQRTSEQTMSVRQVFYQFVQGINLVKSCNRAPLEEFRYFGEISRLGLLNIRYLVWHYLFTVTVGSITVLSTAFVLWYGGQLVLDDELTMGQLIAFNLFLAKLLRPASALLSYYQTLNPATLAALRLFAVWDLPHEIADRERPIRLKNYRGYVEFRDVRFRYQPEDEVLKGVTFEILPGQMAAFCGPSGSGKSTIAKLVLRFYDPSAGRVLVDGIDLRDLRYGDYLDRIGIVMQKPFLFQDTIANNIRYGRPKATDDDVVRAAKLARAHDFIERLPKGYATEVTALEGGLSGGQTQRISIARTILRDPKILVLDEATSALDSETEMQIQTALEYLMQGRTSIVIAHRLSTIIHADRIFVLDSGRIVESGTHPELLAAGGVYHGLFQKHAGLTGDGP